MSRDAWDKFSKTVLVRYVLSYLCGTLYLDPSVSLKRIFAFSVEGLFSLSSHAFNLVPRAFPFKNGWGGVTAFWASPRFGHPHSQIPSVLGIPFSYFCSVLGIPRYPPWMPKSLVFWSSPPKKCWISRENRKRFRDGFR